MSLELNEQEKRIILELIANEEVQTIQGVDHCDTRDFTEILRNRLDILAALKVKIRNGSKQVA
jgi:hypothetical protein